MKKKLITLAITSVVVFGSNQLLAAQSNIGGGDNHHNDDYTANEQDYTAMGVGATTGALIAGPVGLIVGGLVGVLFNHDGFAEQKTAEFDETFNKQNDEAVSAVVTEESITEVAVATQVTTNESLSQISVNHEAEGVMVASASYAGMRLGEESPEQSPAKSPKQSPEETNNIKDIITNSLNLIVYFTPGSVTAETFYEKQFSTVLRLMQEMPDIELNLAGYSDRRGTVTENIQLAAQRVSSIHDYFIKQGIKSHRINTHAYGEKNLLSTSGELDSYMFDRRVVLSFSMPLTDTQNNVAAVTKLSTETVSKITSF